MERKNTVLLTVIAVATLLVAVVGATFAYFTATSTSGGTGGSTTTSTTASTSSVGLNLSPNTLHTYLDYPGGVGVAGTAVEASVTSGTDTYNIAYDLTLKFTNTTGTELSYTLYKSATEITADPSCDLKTENATNATTSLPEVRYSYDAATCDTSAYTSATAVKTGTIAANTTADTTVTVGGSNTTEKANLVTTTRNTEYYYLVVTYPSTGDQTASDAGKTISAQISGATNVVATKVSP